MMVPDMHPCGWEVDTRVQAPEVPKPNLYQSMHHGGTASVLALTPAGAMGMPDSRVKAGEFDQPGMAGMKDMYMEEGHEMSHAEHAPKTANNMQHDMPVDHDKHQMPATKTDHEMTGKSAPFFQKPKKTLAGEKVCKKFRPFGIGCFVHAGCRSGRRGPQATVAALR